MPQASDELREQMRQRFGNPVDDSGPIKFLEEAGYVLNRDWTWSKPGVNELRDMTHDEFECLLFLVHEWDFGSLSVRETQHGCHPSHETRSSDASSYDAVCTKCGATDIAGGGWGKLSEPCPAPVSREVGDDNV